VETQQMLLHGGFSYSNSLLEVQFIFNREKHFMMLVITTVVKNGEIRTVRLRDGRGTILKTTKRIHLEKKMLRVKVEIRQKYHGHPFGEKKA
jgi:hypothetical protein